MDIIRIDQLTGNRITISEIKTQNPTISFAKNGNLSEIGYPTLELSEKPLNQEGYDLICNDVEYEPGKWKEEWVYVEIDLEEYRNRKHEKRKYLTVEKQYSVFDHNGHYYGADENSRSLIIGIFPLALAATLQGTQQALDDFSASLGGGWRDDEGVARLTTAMDMIELGKSLATHIATIDGISQSQKIAINAATTIDELVAIDLDLIFS